MTTPAVSHLDIVLEASAGGLAIGMDRYSLLAWKWVEKFCALVVGRYDSYFVGVVKREMSIYEDEEVGNSGG